MDYRLSLWNWRKLPLLAGGLPPRSVEMAKVAVVCWWITASVCGIGVSCCCLLVDYRLSLWNWRKLPLIAGGLTPQSVELV